MAVIMPGSHSPAEQPSAPFTGTTPPPSDHARILALESSRAKIANLYVNIKDAPYNAIPGQDCTQAIVDAAATGRRIYFPEGIYYTTIGSQFARGAFGDSYEHSRIIQNTPSQPVVIASGEGQHWHDLGIEHASLPSGETSPNGVGIRIRQGNQASVFERLNVRNNTVGIHCRQVVGADPNNYVFSTAFRDLKIGRFTRGAMDLSSAGASNTGCTVSNIYVENWNVYQVSKLTAIFGFTFENFDEIECEQLNCEWGIYSRAVEFASCRNASLNGLHIEGLEVNTSFAGLVQVIGTNSRVIELTGISLRDNIVDIARTSDYALFRIDDNPMIVIGRVQTAGTTKTGAPTMRKFYCPSITSGARIYQENWEVEATWNAGDFFAVTNVVKRTDGERYRVTRLSVEAGAVEFTAVAAASAPNNSIFMDSADNVIKKKDNAGAVTVI